MFLSVEQLKRDMGVDERIARFFVDRRIPQNNRFWKGRLLYLSFGNGFVYIPIFYDMLLRLGVPIESMLTERHVQFMERLMDYAMQHEYEEISKSQELTSTRTLLAGRVTNIEQFKRLSAYLDQPVLNPLDGFGTEWLPLNRADVYLYILCDLPLSDLQWQQALEGWYALVPFYLTLDDIEDYDKDEQRGEENVVLTLGGGPEGFQKAYGLLEKNIEVLERYNPVLAAFLGEYVQEQKQEMARHH